MNPLHALEAARQALKQGQTAYRALRRASKARPDELYPAMIKDVRAGKRIEPGVEYEAEFHPEKAKAMGIAPRYGWHSGEIPYAGQFDVKVRPEDIEQLGLDPSVLGQKAIQPDDMVWSEVRTPGGIDYTDYVAAVERQLGRRAKPEDLRMPNGELVPEGGFYRYDPTNSSKRGGDPWVISDKIQHVRLLADDEVDEILYEMGRPELTGHQRRGGGWTEKRLREAFPSWFASGGTVALLLSGAADITNEAEAANLDKLRSGMGRQQALSELEAGRWTQ